jgi:hypothetical protein
MICPTCCAGAHGRCDDELRMASYGDWLRGEFKAAHPIVDGAAAAVMRASRPSRGCDCQHGGGPAVAAAVPQSIAEASSERLDIHGEPARPV